MFQCLMILVFIKHGVTCPDCDCEYEQNPFKESQFPAAIFHLGYRQVQLLNVKRAKSPKLLAKTVKTNLYTIW